MGIFETCPWGYEGESEVFCYECHEELLHNPVLLPEDVMRLAEFVRMRGLSEREKSEDRSRIAGRVSLFHEVIACGLRTLLQLKTEDQQSEKRILNRATRAAVEAGERGNVSRAASAREMMEELDNNR